jgi:gamma-glutamyltranspeptidase / glutathione hydrolase
VDWRLPYPSIRQPILAANCVATTQPLAAQAGLAMLAKGGNAVDAAIATAVALTVVEPVMNGIGSDAFAIVASGGQLIGLNASGRSPAGWTAARFANAPSMPATGWDSATVPGAVSAWVALHKRFGRLPFETLFEPAIGYARRGFLVSPVVAQIWLRQVALGAYPEFARVFLPEGRAPAAGEVFRCPDHANTLEAIAASDGQAFYRGAIAEAIAAAAKREGGAMTLADLAEHEPEWVTPLGVDFHGVRIHQLPPNGQGLAALIALGVLDRCDVEGLDADSAELQHLAIEATKLGIADAAAHVADPAAMRVEAETLLADGYLRERATLIRRDRAQAPDPGKPPQGGTVYLAAADAEGLMVSYIQSNYRGFGSGIVAPGTGVALNNRGACFSLDPGHPNCVGPRKRPFNTIIPGFATVGGAPLAAFGIMGGSMQPQGHVQIALRLFARGQNPQAAIDAPRWRVEGGDLMVESAWSGAFRAALAARGHKLVDGGLLDFGAGQVIWRLEGGGYAAASESRRDGQAVGF